MFYIITDSGKLNAEMFAATQTANHHSPSVNASAGQKNKTKKKQKKCFLASHEVQLCWTLTGKVAVKTNSKKVGVTLKWTTNQNTDSLVPHILHCLHAEVANYKEKSLVKQLSQLKKHKL